MYLLYVCDPNIQPIRSSKAMAKFLQKRMVASNTRLVNALITLIYLTTFLERRLTAGLHQMIVLIIVILHQLNDSMVRRTPHPPTAVSPTEMVASLLVVVSTSCVGVMRCSIWQLVRAGVAPTKRLCAVCGVVWIVIGCLRMSASTCGGGSFVEGVLPDTEECWHGVCSTWKGKY